MSQNKKNESNKKFNDIPVILTSEIFHVLSYDQSFREPKWYGRNVRHVRQ
jgi:hypothetical protein